MKALICRGFGEGENLALEGRPLPQPGPGQVRVKVLACGANASDWEMITGRPAYGRISRWFLRGRDVFGSDIIGRVEALGPGCTRLQTGQRVAADTFGSFGGFASYAVAAEKLFVPVPKGVSDILAAALPQSGTIALTAMRGRVTPGMKVLVNGGGGGSGSLAIQLAVAEGAEVWGVDTGAKADVMIEAGASRVFDFEAEDWAESGAEFDLILDLWGTRPMRVIRRCLTPNGRYMMVGGPMKRVLGALGASILSLFSSRKLGLLAVNQGPDDLSDLMEMVREERLHPVVGEVTSLEGAREALMLMGARKVSGKLVIVPGE